MPGVRCYYPVPFVFLFLHFHGIIVLCIVVTHNEATLFFSKQLRDFTGSLLRSKELKHCEQKEWYSSSTPSGIVALEFKIICNASLCKSAQSQAPLCSVRMTPKNMNIAWSFLITVLYTCPQKEFPLNISLVLSLSGIRLDTSSSLSIIICSTSTVLSLKKSDSCSYIGSTKMSTQIFLGSRSYVQHTSKQKPLQTLQCLHMIQDNGERGLRPITMQVMPDAIISEQGYNNIYI